MLSFITTESGIWILTTVIGVFGVLGIIVASKFLDETRIWHHLLRDLGIAFVVAAIVSVTYEFLTRTTLDHAKLEGVLKTVLASNIPTDAWEQVNTEILQKTVIRRNLVLRLKLRSDPNLVTTQRVLTLQMTYDLQGLRTQPVKYTLQHALDNEMLNEGLGLPRFDSISIGNRTLAGNELKSRVNHEGIFSDPDLELTTNNPLRVVVTRSEITNKPGTYHFIFGELTQGVRVFIEEPPSDVEVDVKIWSDKGFSKLQPVGNGIWYFDGVMLPGQAFSFRFLNKQDSGVASPKQ